jgi:hypothetical protein
LRLFQVKPASDLQATSSGTNITLTWNASLEADIIGYNVYKSNNEFGIYTKLTSIPISDLFYTDNNFNDSDWYMVRAIKLQTTGSGTFLNPSIGISNNATSLFNRDINLETISIFPNPTKENLTIISNLDLKSYQIIDIQGKVVLTSNLDSKTININQLEDGVYFIKLFDNDKSVIKKFIKI